jgi:hypothetical protein
MRPVGSMLVGPGLSCLGFGYKRQSNNQTNKFRNLLQEHSYF